MKIAIFTDTYEPEINGIVTSTSTFARLLAKSGHEVYLFCPRYKRCDSMGEGRLKIYRYPAFSFATNKNTKIALPLLGQLTKRVKEIGPDIIHVETPMSIGVAGVMVARALNIKLVETYHTYLPDFLVYFRPYSLFRGEALAKKIEHLELTDNLNGNGFYQRVKKMGRETIRRYLTAMKEDGQKVGKASGVWLFTRMLYNRADLVLTPSQALANLLVRNKVGGPVLAQTNGVDFSNIKVKKTYTLTNRIVHFGRLGPEKRVDIILKALQKCQSKTLRLEIIGDGPAKNDLEALAKQLGISDRVTFHGFVANKEVRKMIYDFDFFVTASPMETQGIVLLEAMAAGLPVIGVDKLAVPDVVKDGQNGYLVPANNPTKMALAYDRLMEKSERRREMGRHSIEIASEHEIGRAYKLLEGRYQALIDGDILA